MINHIFCEIRYHQDDFSIHDNRKTSARMTKTKRKTTLARESMKSLQLRVQRRPSVTLPIADVRPSKPPIQTLTIQRFVPSLDFSGRWLL